MFLSQVMGTYKLFYDDKDDAELPIHESIFEQWRHSIHVILAHLTDIFEHERQRLENAVLHVQLGHTVFVHQTGKDGKRGAGLGHDGDGDRRTHTVLTLLHFQVV